MSDNLTDRLERRLAFYFSHNNQPCMSGDPRDRCSPLQRRNLSEAVQAALEEIEAPVAMSGNELNVSVKAEIARVVQSINEWDDRTSPDDYPEHLLITSEELALILNFASALSPKPVTKTTMGEGWMPIETAPKDGMTIIVAAYCDDAKTEKVGCAYWPEAEEWFWWHDQEYPLSENGFEARFWQPLPSPPTAKG